MEVESMDCCCCCSREMMKGLDVVMMTQRMRRNLKGQRRVALMVMMTKRVSHCHHRHSHRDRRQEERWVE